MARTVDILSDKKKLDEAIDKSLPSVVDKIQKEFYADGKLNETQVEALRKVLKDASYGQDTVAKIRARLEDPKNTDLVKMSDVSDLLIEVVFGNMTTLLKLMSYGVIPAHRVAVHMAGTAIDSYKFNVGMVFSRLNLPNPPIISMSTAELEKFMVDAKKNPEISYTMLVEMYRVNGFAAAAIGGAA